MARLKAKGNFKVCGHKFQIGEEIEVNNPLDYLRLGSFEVIEENKKVQKEKVELPKEPEIENIKEAEVSEDKKDEVKEDDAIVRNYNKKKKKKKHNYF